ncbi:MAG: ribonuclease H-like domain-containing protein [Chloroflexi bacterium]|nr:ribonuclease H-like domain-containing protein [Chloroflexota bacterium]
MSRSANPSPVAEMVERVTACGLCVERVRVLPFDGQALAATLPAAAPLLWPGQTPASSLSDLLLLDIETTHLSGAGATIFLVATARIEAERVTLRQTLARHPAEEAGLLAALTEEARLGDQPRLVTYNGRSFDARMLDERATLHRQQAGFTTLPQWDLLDPVRAIYRGHLPSCRLADVESAVLGIRRTPDDVPGAEIPRWYFHWVRSGDGRFLNPLLRHNAQDVLSLIVLLRHLAGAVSGEETSAPPLGLGRLWERAGRVPAAMEQYRAARLRGDAASWEATARLARLLKRTGQPALAVPLWEELAAAPGGGAALLELAKDREHRQRDYAGAEAATEELAALGSVKDDVAHRLRRVRRKRSRAEAR